MVRPSGTGAFGEHVRAGRSYSMGCEPVLVRSYGCLASVHAVELRFFCCAEVPWCLREGQRDRGADEVEGALLVRGRGGELVDWLAGDADGVAGQGGQVVD